MGTAVSKRKQDMSPSLPFCTNFPFIAFFLATAFSAIAAAPLPGRNLMTNFTSRNVSLHSLLSSGHPGRMDCGSAPLCGVLVLESGHGTGKYAHSNPVVHGVWPETGSYGSSKCIKLQDSSSPTKLAAFYDDLSFETHEWQEHGVCAG